jgi:hypothetical protein
MLLDPDELCSLTGYKRPSKQIEWLRTQGWKFAISGLGHPKVDVEEYRRHMNACGATPAPGKAEPDFTWFKEGTHTPSKTD